MPTFALTWMRWGSCLDDDGWRQDIEPTLIGCCGGTGDVRVANTSSCTPSTLSIAHRDAAPADSENGITSSWRSTGRRWMIRTWRQPACASSRAQSTSGVHQPHPARRGDRRGATTAFRGDAGPEPRGAAASCVLARWSTCKRTSTTRSGNQRHLRYRGSGNRFPPRATSSAYDPFARLIPGHGRQQRHALD